MGELDCHFLGHIENWKVIFIEICQIITCNIVKRVRKLRAVDISAMVANY